MKNEIKLISKIIKIGDAPYKAIRESSYGTSVFGVYKSEFTFIENHYTKYGVAPSEEVFMGQFPDFALEEAPDSTDFYIHEAINDYLYSQLADTTGQAIKLLKNNKSFDALDVIKRSIAGLSATVTATKDYDVSDEVEERIAFYEKRRGFGVVTGIPCGIPKVDAETTGWNKSELTVLVGRPGSGKTWVALFFGYHAWTKNFNVLLFSREMGKQQISRRLDSIVTKTRFKDVRTMDIPQDKYQEFVDKLRLFYNPGVQDPWKPWFKIIDTSGQGSKYELDFLRDKIKELRPDIVIVDGAYLISAEGKSEWEKQTNVSRTLKQICLSEQVPILATSQANRATKTDADLSNISFSDSWGQDADNVFFLNRQKDEVTGDFKKDIIFQCLKMREGEPQKVIVTMDLDNMVLFESSDQLLQGGLGTDAFSLPVPDTL